MNNESSPLYKWESLEDRIDGMQRMRIPNGWLYKCISHGTPTVTFVPIVLSGNYQETEYFLYEQIERNKS